MRLNNNQLKLLAMIFMLCDHVGKALLPQWPALQILGRLSMPIFAYMIAEGCLYTRSRSRYFLQLFSLAALCQLVYFFAMGSVYQSILITFSLSLLLIFSIDRFREKKDLLSGAIAFAAAATVLILCLGLPQWLPGTDFQIDYGLFGVLLPVAVYFAPAKPAKLAATAAALAGTALTCGALQWYSLLSLPLLALYNGQRGKRKLKYLFYIFYPTHLALIYLIGLFLQ